jgi:hypothetical protein
MNDFTRVQIEHDNAAGMVVKYKLHHNPFSDMDQFEGLGVLGTHKTELVLPFDKCTAAGIQFQFIGMDNAPATALIKKITIFFKKRTSVIQ